MAMSGVVEVGLQRGMHALQRGQLIMQALIIPHGLIQSCIQGPHPILRTDSPALPLHCFQLQQLTDALSTGAQSPALLCIDDCAFLFKSYSMACNACGP